MFMSPSMMWGLVNPGLSYQFVKYCRARPGTMTCISVGEQFMSGVLVRIVMPFVLGLSWSCVWMKDILGLCFLFKASISLLSEWDSTIHTRARLFLDIRFEIIFHFFNVDGLLAPLMFKEAILMCPISLWEGGGSGAATRARPFAEPARRSLRPWVTAGSWSARGGPL